MQKIKVNLKDADRIKIKEIGELVGSIFEEFQIRYKSMTVNKDGEIMREIKPLYFTDHMLTKY